MGNPGREIPGHDEGKLDMGKRCFILEKPCFDIYFLLIFNNFFFKLREVNTEFCFCLLLSLSFANGFL